MRNKLIAGAMVLASIAVGASSCTDTEGKAPGDPCAAGEGTWFSDESEQLKGSYTVIVRICVSDTGRILDLEVD